MPTRQVLLTLQSPESEAQGRGVSAAIQLHAASRPHLSRDPGRATQSTVASLGLRQESVPKSALGIPSRKIHYEQPKTAATAPGHTTYFLPCRKGSRSTWHFRSGPGNSISHLRVHTGSIPGAASRTWQPGPPPRTPASRVGTTPNPCCSMSNPTSG